MSTEEDGYSKRATGVVHLSDAHWVYAAHLPTALKNALSENKRKTGKSYNLQIVEALEWYFLPEKED